ncbi:MAG: AAA family ATPase [Kiritimatiellae bacterium]|nr:AAA family ATPase [Kiritimatiellia bacterium]
MENKSLQIPYGVADFKTLRSEGLYYVDKTGYIPLLEQAGRFLFLVRPRRFGKSLMASMLRCYYDLEVLESRRAGNGACREVRRGAEAARRLPCRQDGSDARARDGSPPARVPVQGHGTRPRRSGRRRADVSRSRNRAHETCWYKSGNVREM